VEELHPVWPSSRASFPAAVPLPPPVAVIDQEPTPMIGTVPVVASESTCPEAGRLVPKLAAVIVPRLTAAREAGEL
jgi:hypothetical protein